MTLAVKPAKVQAMDMKLEIVVIPVSDIERAKQFYGGLGWRLDADFASDDGFRVIQFTPPGSGASVIFGTNVTAAAAGSAKGLYLVVSDIEAARKELLSRGVKVSEAFHGGHVHAGTDEPHLFGSVRVRIPNVAATTPWPRSAIRTATAGCCRRSPAGSPVAWRVTRPSPRRLTLQRRSAARRQRTASTRHGPGRPTRTGRTGTRSTWSASGPGRNCRHDTRPGRHRDRRRLTG